ncbi:hypothetical protein ABES02_29245 [Neobacillus pocheonensis]|uniref:hypothetical protein n=1 Tax=Neobacillus pocheonensis TaxID=363869 RepID=UPI003D2A1B2F
MKNRANEKFDPAAAMRNLRAKRKSLGVCIYCGGRLVTATMCEYHANLKRTSNEPLADRRKKRYPINRKKR